VFILVSPLQLTEGSKETGAVRILWQAAGLEIFYVKRTIKLLPSLEVFYIISWKFSKNNYQGWA